MLKNTFTILIIGLFLAACDLSNDPEILGAGEEIGPIPGEKVVYATATMKEDLPHRIAPDCYIGKRFQLRSDGEKLALMTTTVPVKGCDNVRLAADFRVYDIEALEYEDGRKTYTATSPLGVIWLNDDRQKPEAEHPWTAYIHEYEGGLGRTGGGSFIQTMTTDFVDDLNLAASEERSFTFIVKFNEEIVEREVKRLCYPLKADHRFGGPVDPDHPDEYLMKIYTDFHPQHAMAQLKAYSEVQNVWILEKGKEQSDKEAL